MSKHLPHHRDHDFESIEECDGFYRSVMSILLIVGIIYALAVFGVEAWFMEAQNQERYYSKPVTNHQTYCSEGCRKKAYNKRRNAKQREQTSSVKPVVEPYQRKNKYKSPISDAEQQALNIAVKVKISPTFDPGRSLSREEIDALLPSLTPPDRMRSVSPLYGMCASHRERWC